MLKEMKEKSSDVEVVGHVKMIESLDLFWRKLPDFLVDVVGETQMQWERKFLLMDMIGYSVPRLVLS